MATTTTTTPDPDDERQGDERYLEHAFNLNCVELGVAGAAEALLIKSTRRMFSHPSTIENPRLRALLWRPAAADSSLLVESVYAWRPELTAQRAAVLVRANGFRNIPRGFGGAVQGNIMDRFGNPHYSTGWAGSVTCFAISGSDIQCRQLASEVQRYFTEFASVFKKTVGFKQFAVVEFGQLAILEEDRQKFLAPVTVGLEVEQRWSLSQHAPRLKSGFVKLACAE